MALTLLPFPRYRRLAFGAVVSDLPVTRNGIRALPSTALPARSKNCFAHLEIRRHHTGSSCRGICGLLPYTAFLDGSVRPHEATLLARLHRQETVVLPDEGALGKPILLTVPSLAKWWRQQDKACHLGDECLDLMGQDNKYTLRDYHPGPGLHVAGGGPQRGLAINVPGPLVIADGHHRAETHARLGERGVPGFAYVPVCIIGADELHIGVFARVLAAEAAVTTLSWLKANFPVEEVSQPQAPQSVGEWLVVHAGRYYRFNRKIVSGAATDVDWLNQSVLPVACGITDTRQDDRIRFEPLTDPTDGLIPDEFDPADLVLISHPLPKERFFAEVVAGRTLPPKSTRFEPRVPSGLVVWEGA